MELNLFTKYKQQVDKHVSLKTNIILYIQDLTNTLLTEDQIEIQGTHISLHVSSIQKSHLHKKHIKDLLKEGGYTLTY